MSYSLRFEVEALREWNQLDKSIRIHLAKKLEKRLTQPRVPAAELSGELKGFYKVKSSATGYRLVYFIQDEELVVLVVAVGRRDKDEIYKKSAKRISRRDP